MGDTETDTRRWWRAMGLVEVPEGTVAFSADDLAMVRALKAVLADGDASEDHVFRLARLLGGSMSRISEAQVSVIEDVLRTLEPDLAMDSAAERSAALASEPAAPLVELFEQSMLYVWRRHLFAALGRWVGVDPDLDSQAIGFVDISGFSHMSKRLDADVLAGIIERFESEVVDVVSAHGGRVVKFIGDEAFFVVSDIPTAADSALTVLERMRDGEPSVDLHGAIAYGPTVTIAGDVFGNTVNLAKRLTDVARKGRILMPRRDAEALEDHDEFAVRKMARTFELKGIGRTPTVSVSRRAGQPG
ncbi:MAG: adenylate/guanylate cyclase domain-containing protein [Microthrixaceae bacterium]